jgi:hypothetical protein
MKNVPVALIFVVVFIAVVIAIFVSSASSRRKDMETLAIERGKRGSDAAHLMEFQDQLVSCKPEIKKIIEEKGLMTKAKQALERAEMLAEGEQKAAEMKNFQRVLTDLGLAMAHCK